MENEVNILAEAKSRTIKLADGKEYVLAPLNLNTMAAIEEEFDCSFQEVSKRFLGEDSKSFVTLRKLLYVFLYSNHPQLTIEDIGNLVTPSELGKVSEAIVKTWLGK